MATQTKQQLAPTRTAEAMLRKYRIFGRAGEADLRRICTGEGIELASSEDFADLAAYDWLVSSFIVRRDDRHIIFMMAFVTGNEIDLTEFAALIGSVVLSRQVRAEGRPIDKAERAEIKAAAADFAAAALLA